MCNDVIGSSVCWDCSSEWKLCNHCVAKWSGVMLGVWCSAGGVAWCDVVWRVVMWCGVVCNELFRLYSVCHVTDNHGKQSER